MIKIEFAQKREYPTNVMYDITDTQKNSVFVVNEKLGVFLVFAYTKNVIAFMNNHKDEGWKRVGTAKFAAWNYPLTFWHKTHSARSPHRGTKTSVNVLFSKEGYDLVLSTAGKGNMASWIRTLIAKELKVKPKDLFANEERTKRVLHKKNE